MATAQVVMLPGCESCEGDDAKWFCEDCCINLCDKCKDAHQRIPKTKNDTIIPVGHAKKGSKKKATPVLCGVHRTKPQLFLQLQGRINVRDPDVERNQKTTTVPQGDVRVVSPKPAIDMQNVKVKLNIQLKGKQGFVREIIPIDNNMAWVVVHPDNHLTLIDVKGNVVKKSLELNGEIRHAVAYQGDILVTCEKSHCVMRLGKDGDTVGTFRDVSPFFTFGLCVTSNRDVLVCLASSLTFDSSLTSKVIRLDSQGEVIQEIQYINQQPLFTVAKTVTSLPTGDVVVVDRYAKDKYRVVCVNSRGNMKYTWNGEVKGRIINNMQLISITHDGQKVYITDYNNHCMYVLDSDGKAEQFMLDKFGIINHVAIKIDSNRRVWIGCNSNIYMLK